MSNPDEIAIRATEKAIERELRKLEKCIGKRVEVVPVSRPLGGPPTVVLSVRR